MAFGARSGLKDRAPMSFGEIWLVPFVVKFMVNDLNNYIQTGKKKGNRRIDYANMDR
jgi:hypothetical protein